MFKQEIIYDKPSHLGTNVWGLSKQHMIKFYYSVIHAKLEREFSTSSTQTQTRLLMTSDIQISTIGSTRTDTTSTWQIA